MSKIALLAMAFELPGAADEDQLDDLLRSGVDAIQRGVGDPPATLPVGGLWVAAGGALAAPYDFDPGLYGMSLREGLLTDPQHRRFLDLGRQALERAGVRDDRGTEVGVFAGCGTSRHERLLEQCGVTEATDGALVETGNHKDYFATRVSYRLDLHGPSVAVQSACSTGLLATHLAVQSLESYECDVALAGAAAIRVPLEPGYVAQHGGIGSPTGACRPFSALADGTVPGDGVCVIVLARLEDAQSRGWPVRVVLRGTAVNNDGRKEAFSSVSAARQQSLIRTVLAVAEVDTADVGYVEAHGTATTLGDAVEWKALRQVLPGVSVGSIKSHIGHLREAAGLAGLIKTVLSVERGVLYPSLHALPPADFIGDGGPKVVTDVTPWRTQGPRRALVNSFGLGGTNVSVVLEQAPAHTTFKPALEPDSRQWQVLPVSAHSHDALDATCAQVAAAFGDGAPLAAVARTLIECREPRRWRRAVVTADSDEAAAELTRGGAVAARRGARVGFVFSGLGDHYPAMGAGLRAALPGFASHHDRVIAFAQQHTRVDLTELRAAPAPPRSSGEGVDLHAMLRRPSPVGGETHFSGLVVSHAALYCLQMALLRSLEDAGLRPDALFGHSLGQVAAAHAAGILAEEDACRIVLARAELLAASGRGCMLSVLAGADDLPTLPASVHVAIRTSPRSCVLAGLEIGVEQAREVLRERGIGHQVIADGLALHTPLMDDLRAAVSELAAGLCRPASTPIVVDTTGRWDQGEMGSPDYWSEQLSRTLHVGDAVSVLSEHCDVLLEVGPGQLRTITRQVGANHSVAVATTVRRSFETRDDLAVYLRALGRCWSAGAAVTWPSSTTSVQPWPLPPTVTVPQTLIVSTESIARQASAGASATADDRAPDAARRKSTLGLAAQTAQCGTEVEQVMSAAWATILGVEPRPEDDFFDLGGDSLMGVRLIASLGGALGRPVPPEAVFHAVRFSEMVASVERWHRSGNVPVVPCEARGGRQ